MSYSYDRTRTAKAPQMPKGKWKLDSKTLANEEAAIKAAVAESRKGGGKVVKIWEQGDAVSGVSGSRGYSVSVKPITRKKQNF